MSMDLNEDSTKLFLSCTSGGTSASTPGGGAGGVFVLRFDLRVDQQFKGHLSASSSAGPTAHIGSSILWIQLIASFMSVLFKSPLLSSY